MLARLILIPLGLLLGAAASLVFLPIATVFDPITREAFANFGFDRIFIALAHGRMDVVDGILTMGTAVSIGLMAVCVVPLVVTALIGEVARLRSYVWYVGAPALLAALMPSLARVSLQTKGSVAAGWAGSPEPTFLALFFLTGAVGGAVYWLIAGRRAMRADAT